MRTLQVYMTILALWLALCAIHTNAQEKAQPQLFDPISAYKQVQIEGFTVLINSKVLAHEEDLSRMRTELEKQLKEIKRVVPDKPLQELKKYRIWVEWEQTKGSAVFHPSKAWLTNKKEYFSELTEAYFGKNDFFPFIHSDLKEYNPVGYHMMVDCWGIPK